MTIWHDFLLTQSITSDNVGISAFAETPPSLSVYRTYVTELCQKSTFFLSGPDVFTFLQGQLTADCRQLSLTCALPTALCTPKGRVICTALIEQLETGYQLTVPRSMAEQINTHLQRYILFSKVTLTQQTDDILIEAGGDDLQGLLSQYLNVAISDQPYHVTHTPQATLTALPGPLPRWQIRGSDPDGMISLWQAITTVAAPIGYPEADRLDLISHLVTIDDTLTEQFLPHMFGYDLIGGMSLKKGCYAGQEVLARSVHRGQIKRHLYRGRCEASHTLSKGLPVLNENGDSIGTLVATSTVPHYHEVLAILRTPAIQENTALTINGSPLSALQRVAPALDRVSYRTV